jgi:L-Ala-D/L-Glu epimerase
VSQGASRPRESIPDVEGKWKRMDRRITEVEWYPYRIPFRKSFTTARGTMTTRDGIIVQVTTEQGISGIGEIAPFPAFGGESLEDANALLPTLAVRLRGMTLEEALDIIFCRDALDRVQHGSLSRLDEGDQARPYKRLEDSGKDHFPSTLCGLEIAILDALGKAEGRPLCALLSTAESVPRASVPVNAVIGARSTEAAIASAKEAVRNGFRCVKLKVGPGKSIQAEIERVAAVREAIGPAIHLRLDANEAWTLEEAIAILSQCVPYAIQYVEQPLQAHDLAGMRTLRQTVPMPIAADEALHGLDSARLILDNEATDVLVIKPQLAGGLRAGQQIIQEAAERGVRSVITSTMESGIGVAAALHLAAASPAVTLECGFATLHLLADDLLVHELSIHEGCMAVPMGPGLGVELDWEALQRWSLK